MKTERNIKLTRKFLKIQHSQNKFDELKNDKVYISRLIKMSAAQYLYLSYIKANKYPMGRMIIGNAVANEILKGFKYKEVLVDTPILGKIRLLGSIDAVELIDNNVIFIEVKHLPSFDHYYAKLAYTQALLYSACFTKMSGETRSFETWGFKRKLTVPEKFDIAISVVLMTEEGLFIHISDKITKSNLADVFAHYMKKVAVVYKASSQQYIDFDCAKEWDAEWRKRELDLFASHLSIDTFQHYPLDN